MTTAAEIAAHAVARQMGGGFDKNGDKYRVRCLVHGGEDRNLLIENGTKGADLVVTCHSHGCDRVAILRAIEAAGGRATCDERRAYQPPPKAERRPRDDDAVYVAARLDLARWLWRRRQSLGRTLAARYLRETRGLRGPLPGTLGFLRAYKDHPPALIAAYGLPAEPEPDVFDLPLDAVQGVQVISLTDDAQKLGKPKTIGRCAGAPIVLAPMGDNLGLAIAEGVEDALSVAEATGLGAWAAGGASRFTALADTVPAYTDWITVLQDDDPAGIRGVDGLVAALTARGWWRPEQIERVLLGAREG